MGRVARGVPVAQTIAQRHLIVSSEHDSARVPGAPLPGEPRARPFDIGMAATEEVLAGVRLLTICRAAPAMSYWRLDGLWSNATVLEVDDASNGSSAPHARRHQGSASLMMTVEANGVTLGVEHFGDAAAPLVLLAGGTTMLSWPDALCEALARGGRHVVRYDLRDSGASTTVDPEAPTYTLRDLAADAAALARELDDRPAHLAGIGVGGMVAQVAALDHPDAFSALTLAGTRPVAPGRVDEDLPDHDAATMERLFSRPMPDWSDRAAVAEFATAGAEILGNDPVAACATAERIWDRTPGTEPAVQMANQLGMVFAKLDCKPRWRERLPELAMPALVVHGRRDPFFPVGNGEALAREIPGARLLVLERAATAIPDAVAGEVAAAMLAPGARSGAEYDIAEVRPLPGKGRA